jgi:hypothetical protein
VGFIDPFIRRRLVFLLAVLALLGLAAGCSSLRFGYEHADTLLLASLDRYFDLDAEQKELAQRRIETLLAWHRATQLEDYSALLREAREKIRGPVTADDVLAFEAKFRQRLSVLSERAAPEIARLALTLQPKQLAHMQGKWAEDDEEFREAHADGDPEEPEKLQARRFIKGTEFWLGELSREQTALVRADFARREGATRFREEERERRRREWLAVLEGIRSERPDPKQATERVRAFFAALADQPDPARRVQAAALRRSNAALIAALVNAATPDQRAALGEKLEGFAGDFTALAKDGGDERTGG